MTTSFSKVVTCATCASVVFEACLVLWNVWFLDLSMEIRAVPGCRELCEMKSRNVGNVVNLFMLTLMDNHLN